MWEFGQSGRPRFQVLEIFIFAQGSLNAGGPHSPLEKTVHWAGRLPTECPPGLTKNETFLNVQGLLSSESVYSSRANSTDGIRLARGPKAGLKIGRIITLP
jgi:hypothetical protein